jgi:peptidoglycan hydrolase CwlO-like protein
MTKYTFKTIVAPEAVRAEFTALRDKLNSSDKELMQAFWNLGIDRLEDIMREVEMLKSEASSARSERQEMKAAAKKVAKPEKVKKAAKPKKAAKEPKIDVSGFEVVYSAADEEEFEMNS